MLIVAYNPHYHCQFMCIVFLILYVFPPQEVLAGRSSSQVELESRVHELTESLIQKQTTLEALGSERSSLRLQLERTQVPILPFSPLQSLCIQLVHFSCSDNHTFAISCSYHNTVHYPLSFSTDSHRASWQLQGKPRPPQPTLPSKDLTPVVQTVSSLSPLAHSSDVYLS